jgi:hypothetical protein
MLGNTMKLLSTTNKQLATLERMVECAYLNGFHFDENLGPKRCAIDLIQELRESIEQEIILAKHKNVIEAPLLID